MKTAQKSIPANVSTIRGCPSTSKIMFELWERNADDLTKEQLEWFANATEYASILTQDLQDVLDGLGCLIAEDGSRRNTAVSCAGNFQSSDDIPTLLFFISRSLDNIQGLIEVSDSARYRLSHPERYNF